MENKLQKVHLGYYNLLIAQDLLQAHYQILSIIFRKEFIKLNVNMDAIIKNVKTYGIKYKYCNCFHEYRNFRDDLIEYKCLCCSNKNYQQKIDDKIKKKFVNAWKFSNHDNNKFNLLLQKGVHPYEYMNDWVKINETSLPEKKDFYSNLTIGDITDADYAHGKRVCKNFEQKN